MVERIQNQRFQQLPVGHEHLFFFGGFALYSHCTVRGTKNIQETHAVSLLFSFPIARTEVSFSIGLVVSWGQIPKDPWDQRYIYLPFTSKNQPFMYR